jgi:hypothetical protein
MELAIIITFLYIIPAILSVFAIIHRSDKVTILDLVGIILLSIVPLLNLFSGYVGGLICLCESEKVNNFLNRRIK